MNQMFVNEIYANGNCNGYECFASIDNYSSLFKKIVVGENVTSNEFALIFPKSVGESKWRLAFYPKGQYVDDRVGDTIGIYLIMMSCERESKTLKANIEFQIKSHTDACAPVKKVETIFNFGIPSKRWIGEPEFVRKKWWTAKRRAQFCDNDCLVIRFLIEEAELDEKCVKVEVRSKDPLEPQSATADASAADGNQIQQQNASSEDPLERKLVTSDAEINRNRKQKDNSADPQHNKTNVNQACQRNGHGNSVKEWIEVGRNGKRNTRSDTITSEPKSSVLVNNCGSILFNNFFLNFDFR